MADFTFITARLATGGAVRSAADAQALANAGITHILDLTDAEDDSQFLPGLGVSYLYNPTADDGTLKPASWWDASLKFAVASYSALGSCLYCHCSAGVNRGPSTAYGVMIACFGMAGSAAEAAICAVRPYVRLAYARQFDAYWAVANPGKVKT